jgi:alkanesulfonate monooxygenase SsuD/methylene tetrahydromethanopterin reductase-like flavin-dependent oxidoreductase (luciferase family)
MRTGLILPPQDPNLGPRDLVELACVAEARGYDAAYFPEAFAWDAFAVMTAVASATSTIELGTAIVTIPVRTPAMTAMGAATVDAVSEGRFTLGLGMGHRRMVTTYHGLTFEPKIKRLGEYVEIVRKIIAREHMQFEGEYLRSVDAQFGGEPARRDMPIYLAALHLDTMRLAGRVADGILPWYATPAYLERCVDELHTSARKAGRDPAEIDVALMIPVWVTDEPQLARETARAQMAWYNNFEFYNRMFHAAGFEDEADALQEAWRRIEDDPELKKRWEKSRDEDGSDCGTAPLVSDEMLDSIFVIGDADHCRKRVAAYAELGVTTAFVFPQGIHTTRDAAMESFVGTIEGVAPGSE